MEYSIEKSAVVFVDCATFSAAELVFEFVEKTLQEETILIVDDFFGTKGPRNLGLMGPF
ncbi:MAG: hypothetical protein KCHDKBKB_00461 [Elusimicrobia bacterium]|nr:hypothetical protein [Elusimicrobiota bacterium]